jgi:hypothetical protein
MLKVRGMSVTQFGEIFGKTKATRILKFCRNRDLYGCCASQARKMCLKKANRNSNVHKIDRFADDAAEVTLRQEHGPE